LHASSAFDAGLRPRPFPDETASLLPDPLAATRTGLSPASDDELTKQAINHLHDQPPIPTGRTGESDELKPVCPYDPGAVCGMIARMWRGWVRTENAAAYVNIVERTGMAGYRQTPGNAGAQLLTRDLGDGRTEVITLSWWHDLNDIKAFAGEQIDVAKYYPEDDEYLIDREATVAHFEVAPPAASDAASSAVHH
jgi:heme-degrading monooxygenase HmoA